MSDTDPTPESANAQPTVERAALSPDDAIPSIAAASPNGTPASAPATAPAERPELVVGAAFAGGFALALVLRRLVR